MFHSAVGVTYAVQWWLVICSSVVVSALQYMLLQSVGLSGCVTGAGQDTWAGHLLPNCPTLPLRTLDSTIISLPVKPWLDHTAVVSLPVKCRCTVVRGTEETLMRCTLHTFLPALHTSHCTIRYTALQANLWRGCVSAGNCEYS